MAKEYLKCLNKPGKLPVLGKGVYGKVYKLNEKTCVKVNKDPEVNKKEVELYKIYGNCPLFPKYYGCGQNYIVMELIKGESLRSYLDKGGILSENILKQLIKMFEEGIKAGLSLNPNARHIILTSEEYARLVDVEDIIKFSSAKPFMLMNRLNKYAQKQAFLEYLNNNSKWLMDQWEVKNKNKDV
ncbi:MAG: hypothetical protein CVU89_03215 [Firmicutes bacterium HGW-Firmicutes-14]|nr:MAG: hypothetical protein CVU89_03215 [Firmicutes bacterium HGW-Firmicutes-14]